MIGVIARATGVLVVACVTACGVRQAPGKASVTRTLEARSRAPAGPVYRFISLGVTHEVDQQALDGGRIGVITDGPPGRAIVNPDGSVELSSGRNEHLMGGVAVPARLGGGFVFWDDVLYRARTFTGPLEPIATLATNAVGVEFGPDYLLLLSPGAPPRAFTLDPPGPRPLSPPGVIDIVATDDGRALSLDAAGRALASTDAGKTWNDVTSKLGASLSGVYAERNEVGFVLDPDIAWLQVDGQFRKLARAAKPKATRSSSAELLRRAFSTGLELPGLRAWIGEGRGTTIVDLRTGEISPVRVLGSEGSNCVPVSLEDGGLVACFDYSSEPATTLIAHALGATPLIEKTFPSTPQLLVGRGLSVLANCAGAAREGAACVRGSGGNWREVKMSVELLEVWQPLFWVTRAAGGVALVVGERDPTGEPKIGLLDLESSRLVPWDATAAQVTPSDPARLESSFTLFADGSVRGYARTNTITVDAKGHVTPGAHRFAAISSAGARALARDDDERLWQTVDYGARWFEVARPPFDDALGSATAKVNPRPSGRATRSECSQLGCALEHPSGTGVWLRMGWPEDAPKPALHSSARPARTDQGGVVERAPPKSEPVLPKLRCSERLEGRLPVTRPARAPANQSASEQTVDLSFGRGALAQPRARPVTSLSYRDVFSSDQEYVSYGLRGALHFESAATEVAELIGTKTRFSAEFVEPLDPIGRVRQMVSSTSGWSTLEAHAGTGREQRARATEGEQLTQSEPVARPLLSSAVGHAGGVLFQSGALSLAVSNTGPIRAIPRDCHATSGYIDAQGRFFVACAERDASTHIEALVTPPRELVRALPASRDRDSDAAGLHFFAPGEPVFNNPDAIAFGRDGKLGILRLPPGDAPPTADNPAWLLRADSAPVALAPWSTLELATMPACSRNGGYRALVQTGKAWFQIPAGATNPNAGMSALVSWSTERVCLEAVELGFGSLNQAGSSPIQVSLVARFAGLSPGAAFVGTDRLATRRPAICELAGP